MSNPNDSERLRAGRDDVSSAPSAPESLKKKGVSLTDLPSREHSEKPFTKRP